MLRFLLLMYASLASVLPAGVFVISPASPAPLLASDDFEGNRIAGFWRAELLTPAAGQLTRQLHRHGRQAMRFTWRPDQADGTNTTLHAELATEPLPAGENERWYGYSLYLPASTMADDTGPVIVTQWHGFPDPGGAHTVPPVAVSMEATNRLQLVYRASDQPIQTFLQHPTSTKTIDLGVAKFDVWVDYVVHIRWDATGKTGVLQLWQNGKLVVDERGVSIGYNEQRKPYWKIGLYAWTGKSIYPRKSLLYDDIRIGSAEAMYPDVCPGLVR